MNKAFDINSGLLNVLRGLLHDGNFAHNVIELLLGDKDAPWSLECMLKRKSYDNTLNEVVAIHRLFKRNLNESFAQNNEKDEGLVHKLLDIRKKSMKFQTQVIVKTLKKPGAVVALVKLIATEGTDAKSWAVLAPMVVDSAVDVASENKEKTQEPERQEMSMNESAISNRLRRVFKHGSHSVISENAEDRYGGRIPVNVYTGRFQPFHLGHLSNLEEAAKRGLRTVICPVMKGSSAKAKDHPFEAVEGEMFEKIKNAYGDLVADIVPIKNPFIEFWVIPLRERGFEPIMWTTGTDRQPSYAAMVEKYKDKYELVDSFEVVGLDKDMEAGGGTETNTAGISGTAIRKCLVDGDEEGFRRQMPKCLWDMYGEMREIMMQQVAPAQQTSLTEDEIRRKLIDEAIERLVKGKK